MKQPFQLPEKMARFRGQFEQSARDFLIGTVIKGHKHKKQLSIADSCFI
ncbi:hypothetical protein NSQ93_07805 [Bacillus sp. FSL W8-0445]|jgi:hypothetical protein|uniref:Uncharacterized protein n=2 Tax=Bacillus licheniformis TaxID=1402 RepID=Q65E40_BACLD|nr:MULTISPECIES: hypothetical protein [Bacillus]AAU42674.1 hypothetical protein BLi03859 [Bacillus licheniformis DSM 13 = ATCC 14580]MBJ7885082.1 hypothetical protein [Bacillaceae bacterium HSR45]MDP4168225.1 hypothetical protein [Bacillota bacterium]ABP97415.1 hypothetical protein BL07065 [Bacillus licheniformis DSM 13 = ATCC 14580]ARC63640.1 hypothetical protein B14_00613 [Bacillus licheniformis]